MKAALCKNFLDKQGVLTGIPIHGKSHIQGPLKHVGVPPVDLQETAGARDRASARDRKKNYTQLIAHLKNKDSTTDGMNITD